MATPTRLDRYVSRVEQDQRTHDLLILIHTYRGQGWKWSDIVSVLADAIDERHPLAYWSGQLHDAFVAYAGPYRLWETVMQAIALAWGQERERDEEAKEMQH